MWAWIAVVVVVAAIAASAAGSGDTQDIAEDPPETTLESGSASTASEPPETSELAPSSTADATADTAAETTVAASTSEPEPTTTGPPPPQSDEVAGSPAGATGSRDAPVPAGEVADIGDGWRLQVLNVIPDATALVAAENQFNEPPPPGSTFTIVTVALGYFGREDPKVGFETTISAVGGGNLELESGCGVVPSELDTFVDLFSGAVAIGNLCFVTTPDTASTIQLYASGGFFGGEDVFLAASAAPVAAVPMSSLAGPQDGARATPDRRSPIAIGTATDVGEGWTFTVTGPVRDITDAVLAENQFNEPPPDGFRFAAVDVSYTYNGAEASQVFVVTMNAVGMSNRQLSKECGVTPGASDNFADIFPGGSVSDVLCFVVPADELPTLVLYGTAELGGDASYFATG